MVEEVKGGERVVKRGRIAAFEVGVMEEKGGREEGGKVVGEAVRGDERH